VAAAGGAVVVVGAGGGLVACVVGAACVGAAAGGAVVGGGAGLVAAGALVVLGCKGAVVGGTVEAGVLAAGALAGGTVVRGVLALALDPGCSRATVTPMKAAAPVETRTMARVSCLRFSSARARARGEYWSRVRLMTARRLLAVRVSARVESMAPWVLASVGDQPEDQMTAGSRVSASRPERASLVA
jgi:hypothetical protein